MPRSMVWALVLLGVCVAGGVVGAFFIPEERSLQGFVAGCWVAGGLFVGRLLARGSTVVAYGVRQVAGAMGLAFVPLVFVLTKDVGWRALPLVLGPVALLGLAWLLDRRESHVWRLGAGFPYPAWGRIKAWEERRAGIRP